MSPKANPAPGGSSSTSGSGAPSPEKDRNPDYSFSGTEVALYANGAYSTSTAGLNEFSAYGEPGGETVLEYVEGPYSESTIYSIYGSQDAAVLALKKGDIDFMLNPSGAVQGATGTTDGRGWSHNPRKRIRWAPLPGVQLPQSAHGQQGFPAGGGNAD